MITSILATALVAASPASIPAPSVEPQPITIGDAYAFKVLEAERQVNVILPPDYHADPERKWPVVFMLDGGISQDLMMGVGILRWNALWGRSKDVIWVGIETKDRQRELLPPTADKQEQERYPTAGESAAFRRWIAETLIPLIEQRYHHDGTAFLLGESAAGHFVFETWLNTPELFDGYAAISPSLQWDSERLSQSPASLSGRAPLYISLADEGGGLESGVDRVIERMGSEQNFCFSDRRGDLVHATSLHGLLPEALQYLLPTKADWLEEYGMTLRCDKWGGGGRNTSPAGEDLDEAAE